MTVPPLLQPDNIDRETLEDIRRASREFFGSEQCDDAYERMICDPPKRCFVDAMRGGRELATDDISRILVGFLRSYHVQLRENPSEDLARALPGVAKQINATLRRVMIEGVEKQQLWDIADVFDQLDSVRCIGPTAASKILSVLRPGLFVMWDGDIAEAYGFEQNAVGYCRFVVLMRDVAHRLRNVYEGARLPLEEHFCQPDRCWQPPLAKFLDEWNWVRITRGRPAAGTGEPA